MLCGFAGNGLVQKQTFEVITYAPPEKWIKEVKENIIGYAIVKLRNQHIGK